MQKLASLRSPRFKNNTSHMRRMNLAALVVPGIITAVCVMVGLLTLHEYCAVESAAGAPARCFLPVGSGDVIDSASNLEHLKFTKIAAISFYAGSLLTTAGAALAPGRSGGPLKLSLMLYHTLICLWSTVYYTLDFLDRVPLIRSERDGMIEYSAMRVLAVWPVTSTLMISKIAVLCMMTRHVVNDGAEEGADGGAEGADPDDGWRELGWARPFARLVDAMNLTSRISDRVDGDEVMSTSWDVWFVSLVNNLMLLAGAFGLVADNYWVRAASMATSCALFVIIMLGFRLLFAYVVARVRHPDDVIALRSLEKMTYFTWTLFPVIQLLREFRYIDTATQFLLMTGADIVAKMSYSTNLIFSNFWLINAADGLMRLDEDLFTDALELSRCSQLAAQTLEKAKLEAESVSNLHRAFVANISHELRTPLNSIIAFNSLLMEDETLSEAQREFVASAIVSAEALLGIIGQILDFAKLESGSEVHQELVIESFDVNDVMNELVDIVGHQANKNQVELVLDIDPSLDGLVVRGDKFRLRQALINVTNNSIKYTREGGEVRIRVDCLPQAPRRPRAGPGSGPAAAHARASAWLTGSHADIASLATTSTEPPSADDADDAPRLWVRFEVVDTGIGIAEDKIGVIFMPFGQASISSTREYGGTGLGLAITSNIVRALGGVITCKSALGRGTSMTLEIPLAVPERPGETTAPPPIAHFAFRRAVSVVSVVANASLADAVGRVARGGGARYENLPAARTFPHTAYQRATWARELCGAIRRRWCGGDADVVLVVEEGFLAPMWAEWHASYGDERLPPVVAVVGKKTLLRDDAPVAVPARANANDGSLPRGLARGALERVRRISGSVRVPTASGGIFGVSGVDRDWDRDSDSPASAATAPRAPPPHDRDEDPAGMEAGWRALLRSTVQVVRPVKPSAMRAAMRRAEAMLERADAGGAADDDAFGGGRVRPADATNGATRAIVHGGANGAGVTWRPPRASRASVTEPNADEAFRHVRGDVRVTRSAARRASAAEISEVTADGDARGGVGNGVLVDDAGTQPPPQPRARDPRVSVMTDGENRSYATAMDEPPFRHGGKVLIVEDNLMNQKVASVVVKHCGMTADLANNGKEAVEMLRAGARYDVVLMDVQMPVMDGLDATRAIRRMELSGEIRGRNFIVATSANATAENHQEGFAAGMDEYITKPIYPSRLKELLMLPKVREAEEVAAAAAEGAEAKTGEVTSAATREREAPRSRRTGAAAAAVTGVVTRRRNAARNR